VGFWYELAARKAGRGSQVGITSVKAERETLECLAFIVRWAVGAGDAMYLCSMPAMFPETASV
jgi:hypothetical protein